MTVRNKGPNKIERCGLQVGDIGAQRDVASEEETDERIVIFQLEIKEKATMAGELK